MSARIRSFEDVEAEFGPSSMAMATLQREASAVDLEPVRRSFFTGSKFAGGFGATEILTTDYWTLRQRSIALFEQNLYARGLIRRLVTNEINVGLHLEATPAEKVLGKQDDELAEWTEDVETRFDLWEKNPAICDQRETSTFGKLQAQARREALVCGDVLVVLRQDQRTKLPRIDLISGDAVQTPFERGLANPKIVHGVELDAAKRHVAYWVRQDDGTAKRLPAFGEKSGRRIAWLLYGTDKRVDDVRGKPLLALMLQALKELDRYRDAALRKAVINSMVALIVKQGEASGGGSGFVRKAATQNGVATTGGETPRSFAFSEMMPGGIVEHLKPGEEPTPFPSGADVDFPAFEEAIIQTIAWAHNVPPEILRLAFSNNYSASQAAINEFKIYLNLIRTDFGQDFCQPIYVEWLLASALSGHVVAKGLLEAHRDFSKHDIWGAWVLADWSGHIKPAVDMSKLVTGYAKLVEEGWITRDRACRELTGMKFSRVVKQLARENPQLAEALAPILKVQASAKAAPPPPGGAPPSPSDDIDHEDVDDEDGDPDSDERSN